MFAFAMAMLENEQEQRQFESIYLHYHKQMLLIARNILQHEQDAEDAVQSALLGIVRNLHTLSTMEEASIRAYVLVAAKNQALSLLRERRKSERSDSAEPLEVSDDIFDNLVKSQDYERLACAMRALEQDYRELLMLYYVQELRTGEIARLLGCSDAAVRKQLARGKRQLLILFREEQSSTERPDCAGREAD